MARPKRAHLNVFLNSRTVGTLNRASSGAVDFRYDGTWLEWEHAIPVSLSLPLREDKYIGAPVLAVFDNLLPDNADIRRRFAEKSKAQGDDTYNLLSAVGRDCVGALQFLPDGEDPGKAGGVSGRKINEENIAAILADLKGSPLGAGVDREFRISIAGAHEKTALLNWRKSWMIPHGATPTTHILKPAIGKLGNGIDLSQSVENEYLCLALLRAFGLPTATCEIAEFAGRRVLVVERFDRRRTRDQRLLRVPQEDLCQALSYPPTMKYENDGGPGIPKILGLLRGSDAPDEDRLTFLKAQIAFWLLGATDGHAKNFSIHLSPGGRFRLAPLYDVLSAQPYLDSGQIRHNQMKMAMAIGDNRHYVLKRIHPRHFIQIATSNGIGAPAIDAVFEEFSRMAGTVIDQTLDGLTGDFPESLANSVITGLRGRLAILRQTKA
jgi:serine/threonine-protein kinase HipA